MTGNVVALPQKPLVDDEIIRFAREMIARMQEDGVTAFAYSFARSNGSVTQGVKSGPSANMTLLLGSMYINATAVANELERTSVDVPAPENPAPTD